MNKEIITLSQKPIIDYSMIVARGKEVRETINSMNIDTIDVTEENRRMMKKIRAELNGELDVFESQRKMIHAEIEKPYKEFSKAYSDNIKNLYKEATEKLKCKIDLVEHQLLTDKTNDLLIYFRSKSDGLSFIELEQVGVNITLSASINKLKKEIDGFIDNVKKDMSAISGMDHSVRIESLYKTNLDLSFSVSTVNADIKREEQLEKEKLEREEKEKKRNEMLLKEKIEREEQEAKERIERKKRELEIAEEKRIQAEENARITQAKEADDALKIIEADKIRASEELKLAEQEESRLKNKREQIEKEKQEENKIYEMEFTVHGTINQLKEIKQFMLTIGVDYE